MSTPRGVLAVGVAALVAAVWAASVRRPPAPISDAAFGGPVRQFGVNDTPNQVASELLGSKFVGPLRALDAAEGVIGYAVVALLAALLLACLVLVVRALVSLRRPPPPADVAPDLDLADLARAVASTAQERLAALSGGTPAEGVIAAWAHLEAALHAAKVPLPAARTSSEVTVDVLRRFAVDDATLRGLAELYREARWSRHPLTEDDRARAADAYRLVADAVATSARTTASTTASTRG